EQAGGGSRQTSEGVGCRDGVMVAGFRSVGMAGWMRLQPVTCGALQRRAIQWLVLPMTASAIGVWRALGEGGSGVRDSARAEVPHA
ncbi:hypothetical protein E2562_009589, partial [Oryza meyeriana var. granulata]